MKSGNGKYRTGTQPRTALKAPVDLKSVRKKKQAGEIPTQPNTRMLKRREFFMLLVFTLSLFFMLYRVGFIQFVKGEEYQKKAYSTQTQKRMINPKRGTIYDRNGKGLAISASVDTVSVNPNGLRSEVKEPEKLQQLAQKLGEMLEMDAGDILEIFYKNSRFEYIKRKIDRDLGARVRNYVIGELGLQSIYIDEDSKRYYPNGSLAAHVLGFTGVDDQGLAGIELKLDATLRGMPGKIMNEVDVLGRPISFSKERYVEAVDGYDVFLTIDETIQYFTEKALEQAALNYNLKRGAAAIVMNPNTGEILAMASYPDFDPNDPDAKPDFVDDPDWKGFSSIENTNLLWSTVFRNKVVNDTYEPGSTFKAITAAAALEEGIVRPETTVVCKPYSLAGHTINCWHAGGHGQQDFAHAVYNSCNPVFVQEALAVGIDKFYSYVRMFGFQKRTGLELAGEPTDEEYRNLWHKNPTEIDLAVAGFGQRFQISPIQLATAYCAIANGGNLMKPMLVKQISDSNGNIIQKFEPQVIRKVISEETSRTVRTILEGVVSEGTGKNAYVSGYRIAGKTGTSETLQTESEGRYVVSFAAIAPADKPEIVVLVVLDHPQVEMHLRSGGILAAPVAGKLCEDILEYLQVERQYSEEDMKKMTEEVYVPSVVGLTVKEAVEKLKAYNLNYLVEGSQDENAVVTAQTPRADFSVPRNSTVILYTEGSPQDNMVPMPDLTNKTVDEATATMRSLGLNIRIKGEGTALSQQYEPGTLLPKGEVVDVEFMLLIAD
ncbi:MAG TPA: penicillin-binding transpeptidase domain-containing protein [Thermoclostridium caenicola]|uniref:Stage V sporulation protein D (Sporulation-specific penicillin-binding protein) n=1 Tax=Thermoclostridium caenicola TaxID=659425 RepID=A0A1M6FB68_9FIRM|nr:PASTA domain-containing penicillin-binding protein [Thermoclostridium caenicola]SHI94907.1 stage V sporulation protein D (sporulation-specific penicillin-binding protein) [Thermoclostridium caenicola]HOK42510.1 penicillin-binding transpeptidase domain-containing protein [Thermoclostridium caenicola]HOP72475.1 penicillin-binding transpeptidase domain-containing protein [Thermoclostridium caenicola]HPO76574.1 penicillin-binding transpeptidase domain-containing protein [Thermoclostridium caenic